MRKKIIFLLLMSVFVLSGFVSLAAAKNPIKIVTINNFSFKPSTLTIKANTKVTWKNSDKVPHTVVSTDLFESKMLTKGKNFTFKFTTPGTYDYNCSIHPSMKGKIIVK